MVTCMYPSKALFCFILLTEWVYLYEMMESLTGTRKLSKELFYECISCSLMYHRFQDDAPLQSKLLFVSSHSSRYIAYYNASH